jgi:hypothetical protein
MQTGTRSLKLRIELLLESFVSQFRHCCATGVVIVVLRTGLHRCIPPKADLLTQVCNRTSLESNNQIETMFKGICKRLFRFHHASRPHNTMHDSFIPITFFTPFLTGSQRCAMLQRDILGKTA